MMKKILIFLVVLATIGMAAAQDIVLEPQSDGTYKFDMPERNLMMNIRYYNANDTENGYTIGGVPDEWKVRVFDQEATITEGVTTPISGGAPVTIVPPDSIRRLIKRITLRDALTLTMPMTMEALTNGTIVISVINPSNFAGMKYSVNSGDKTLVATTTTINVQEGDRVQFYGNGTSTQNYGRADINVKIAGGTARVKLCGNIMSLLDEEHYNKLAALPAGNVGTSVFSGLFDDNDSLMDASGLFLPAMTLTERCYSDMFKSCDSLKAAPALPATTLANECYARMFKDCKSLTEVPDTLPAMTLVEGCYSEMFYNCESLTTPPVLPATALVKNCYSQMFYYDRKLSSVTCLATTGINDDASTNTWMTSSVTCTFFADPSANWPVGVSGIPSGCTRKNLDGKLFEVLLSEVTTNDIGRLVCSNGHAYADPQSAVPDGVTAVGILGKVTTTGHGLIIALKDAPSQTWNTINGWTSVTTYASTTLKVLPNNSARGSLTSYTTLGGTTVSNWAVAQMNDYVTILNNLGSKKNLTYDDNVNACFTNVVGGAAFSGTYWSATAHSSLVQKAWVFNDQDWDTGKKVDGSNVRPVLGF